MTDGLNEDVSIVILAAGQGSRMQSELPKALHLIGGKPMLAHVLDTAEALQPAQIIVVYGYAGDKLRSAFLKAPVRWVFQEKQQGTGDAVLKALPLIPSSHRILILYADVPLISKDSLRAFMSSTPPADLGVMTAFVTSPFGLGRVVRNAQGSVLRIVEEKDAKPHERDINEINTGIFLGAAAFMQQALACLKNDNAQQEYYLTDIVQHAVQADMVISTMPVKQSQEVLGVNDRAQQAMVERYYQAILVKKLMNAGTRVLDPARVDIRGTLEIGREVTIDLNVLLEGHNQIAAGCYIGPHSVLINCVLEAGVHIQAYSYLEGVRVGRDSVIGPFARLRPGTVIEERVRVGNFVELKNTVVGEGSKVSHLTYLGDAVLGKEVNVGAGTITCNYDGVNKHKTVIEDFAHIGSDSQLIAPVRVGKGATLGAGTTLCKDAPAYQLTLTHSLVQRSCPWERAVKQNFKEGEGEEKG